MFLRSAPRYGAAVGITVVVLAVTYTCREVLAPVSSALFFAAVALSAWLGGLGPAMAASALSVLALDYFILDPLYAIDLTDPSDTISLLAFLVVALIVSGLSANLRRARDRAEAAQHALEQNSQARDGFIALIAHDLKGPITAIRGYAELMQARGAYSARAVDVIVQQTERLERLIGDLKVTPSAGTPDSPDEAGAGAPASTRWLTLHPFSSQPHAAQPSAGGSVPAGAFPIQPIHVDLLSILQSTVAGARHLSERHVLSLRARTDRIEGDWDRDRVAQVVENIVGNAVKYSPDGGEVVIEADVLDGSALVSVRDEGVGIPSAALGRLFDRAYRVPDTAARLPGQGLGLYICRQIVEAHGGQLWAESAGPGHGSTFRFSLPTAGGPSEGRLAATDAASSGHNCARAGGAGAAASAPSTAFPRRS